MGGVGCGGCNPVLPTRSGFPDLGPEPDLLVILGPVPVRFLQRKSGFYQNDHSERACVNNQAWNTAIQAVQACSTGREDLLKQMVPARLIMNASLRPFKHKLCDKYVDW